MRYAQGGGLSDERRQFREGVRVMAAERFAEGEPSSAIARELRVSVRSIQRWRRLWDKGGPRALRSAGSASVPRLSQLPAYAPELDPVEGVWSLPRRGYITNVAFSSTDHLIRTVRQGLRKIQYRPALLDGCLAEAGLTLQPA